MVEEAPATEPRPDLLFAERYRIGEELGRGASGEVHRAFDTKLSRDVAIKLLGHDRGEAGGRYAQRLRREALAVASLNHPNIAAVHDVGEHAGTPFIVMELVDGTSLARRMDGADRPTLVQTLDWLEDIADALDSAHRAAYVHRDIKPDNLLVDSRGRVKVVDFGIVKALESADRDARLRTPALTARGGIVGTPEYMAPEQLRAEAVDGRADQYAWGIVALELLARMHPYKLTPTPTTPRMVADGLFMPPLVDEEAVPLEVQRVFHRSVAAEKGERFESMADARLALAEVREATATMRVDASSPVDAPVVRVRTPNGIVSIAPSHASRRGTKELAAMVESPVSVGDLLAGKYRIERILGVGGMGVILVAHHTELDERVALKVLRPDAAITPETAARFMREARAAAKIRSEHVARVYDVGTLAGGAPYLVMEYLEGADLSEVLVDRGPLSVEDALDYVLQGCEALAEAHLAGIVHRDIKPANLFLSKRADGSPCLKLLDFGISKVTSQATMTHAHALMGSPLYMSPEQLNSPSDVDASTDIWSVGVTLYELLSGQSPFDAPSIPALIAAITQQAPRKLSKIVATVPPGLEAVIRRCLEKDRRARFDDVGALALALAPFAARRSQVSVERTARLFGRGDELAPSLRPPAPTRRWALIAALTPMLLAAAVVAVLLVLRARAQPKPAGIIPPARVEVPPTRPEPASSRQPEPLAPAPSFAPPPRLVPLSASASSAPTGPRPAKPAAPARSAALPDDRL
jgi:serine/threonine-protein kinase